MIRAIPASLLRLAVPAMALLLGACATNSPYNTKDPLEPVNRKVFAFNMAADKYVIRPTAVGYTKVVPVPIRKGVHNFFSNLTYPTVFINDALQGKFMQSGEDFGRFLINTTLGVGGVMDVASKFGYQENDEDLGQTLGTWGVGEGWYLMVPVIGPSTNRDLVGTVGDNWTEPLQYVDGLDLYDRIIIYAIQGIDTRSRLLDFDSILAQQLDPYVFMRTVYLERRQNLQYDGNPPPPDLDLPED